MQLDEDLQHRLGEAGVHGEALARPVAGGAETLQLVDDGAAGFLLPGPDLLEESLAAHGAAVGAVLGGELALDHHLRGDAGMVGARLPENVPALHAPVAAEHVLQRVVERVADVQRARDVGRRNDDAEAVLVLARLAAGLEGLGFRPGFRHAGLHGGGLECLVHHDAVSKREKPGAAPGFREDVARVG